MKKLVQIKIEYKYNICGKQNKTNFKFEIIFEELESNISECFLQEAGGTEKVDLLNQGWKVSLDNQKTR